MSGGAFLRECFVRSGRFSFNCLLSGVFHDSKRRDVAISDINK